MSKIKQLLSDKDFKSVTAVLDSGNNPVHSAKLLSINYVYECLRRYDTNPSMDFIKNAAKAIEFMPYAFTEKLVELWKSNKTKHSVSFKNPKKGMTVKKNQIKVVKYDPKIAVEFKEWADAKVEKVHAKKPKADFDPIKYVKQVGVKCSENAGLELMIADSWDAKTRLKILASWGVVVAKDFSFAEAA